jgi:hypothetical protein
MVTRSAGGSEEWRMCDTVWEGVRLVGEGDWKREVMMGRFATLPVWLLSWKKTDKDST